MYHFKRILTLLHYSSDDAALVQTAAKISKITDAEKMYFSYVAKSLDIPEKILKDYPEIHQPLDESISKDIKDKVAKNFQGHPETGVEFLIREGHPLVETLKDAKQKLLDLIILQADPKLDTDRNLAIKLARKAPCSVLILPKGKPFSADDILIPVDFSENSPDALEIGVAFGSAAKSREIMLFHSYDLPKGYYKAGKSEDQFNDIMLENIEETRKQLMEGVDLRGTDVRMTVKRSSNPANAVEEFAHENNTSLMVLGTRGRSEVAAILLGSMTEKLISRIEIPILAAKKKGANMGLLDALFEM